MSTKIKGYVVKNNKSEYLDIVAYPSCDWVKVIRMQPPVLSRSAAHRRLAKFFDENDGWNPQDSDEEFYVAPVFCEATPLENAAEELGELLSSLCARHGLDLGLTQDQINKKIAEELQVLTKKSSG